MSQKLSKMDKDIKEVDEMIIKEEEKESNKTLTNYIAFLKEEQSKMEKLDEEVNQKIALFEEIEKEYESLSDKEDLFNFMREKGFSGEKIDTVLKEIKEFEDKLKYHIEEDQQDLALAKDLNNPELFLPD